MPAHVFRALRHAMRRPQALILAAVTFAASVGSWADGEPLALSIVVLTLAAASVGMAVSEDARVSGTLGALVYLGHLTLANLIGFAGLASAPAMMATDIISFFGHLFMSVVLQSFAGQVLPLWLVLVMAEWHTIAHWRIVCKLQPQLWQQVKQLVLTQLAGVILPLLLLHYTKQQQHTAQGSIRQTAGAAGQAHSQGTQPQKQGKEAGGSSDVPSGQLTPVEASGPSPGKAGVEVAGQSAPTGTTLVAPQAADAPRVMPPHSTTLSRGRGRTTTSAAGSGRSVMSPQSPSFPYQSQMGKQQTVCIKIATHHHPASLPPGALQALAHAVNTSTYGRSVVLGAAVRHGCILISLDARCLTPTGSSPPNTAGSGLTTTTAADHALACAQQLLPGLLQSLGLCGETGGCGSGQKVLEPGQYLSLQLDNQVVMATINPNSNEWVFSVAPVGWGYGSSLPKLGLARPCHPPSTTASDSHQPAATASSQQPQPAVTGQRLNTHTAAFEVQVWCGGGATALVRVAGSDPGEHHLPAAQHGPASLPAAAGAVSRDGTGSSQKPSLQLWVHCQGQYLHTLVEPVVSSQEDGSDSGAAAAAAAAAQPAVVQAVVRLPAAALARHHQPGGPAARLQLLTAELWSGDSLLSSAPLLLDAEQHLQPPAATTSTFGWWGASATAAAGLVHEVATLAACVQATAVDDDAEAEANMQQSCQEFVSDLAAWLLTMQHAAPGTCCDMCVSPNGQQFGGVGLVECWDLAKQLQSYAAACQLPMTLALLRSQCSRVLQPWQDSAQRGGTAGGSGCSTPGDAQPAVADSPRCSDSGGTASSRCSAAGSPPPGTAQPFQNGAYSCPANSGNGGGDRATATPAHPPRQRGLRARMLPLWKAGRHLIRVIVACGACAAGGTRAVTCPTCDSMYYDRLRAYLHHVWVYASLIRALWGVIMVYHLYTLTSLSLITCSMSIWSVLHMSAAVLATRARSRAAAGPTAGPPHAEVQGAAPAVQGGVQGWPARCRHWLVHEGGCQILAWVIRLLVSLGLATRFIVLPTSICRPSTHLPYVATDAVFVLLTEQLHGWGRLPDSLVRHMTLIEALTHVKSSAGRSCPAQVTGAWWWVNRVWFPAATVVLPAVMGVHWRTLLTPVQPGRG